MRSSAIVAREKEREREREKMSELSFAKCPPFLKSHISTSFVFFPSSEKRRRFELVSLSGRSSFKKPKEVKEDAKRKNHQ